VTERYLREMPIDPFTNSSETWQTVPAEPEPGRVEVEPGIFDVHSGAATVALDGTSYSEW
jgi:general secretion pathway protein G